MNNHLNSISLPFTNYHLPTPLPIAASPPPSLYFLPAATHAATAVDKPLKTNLKHLFVTTTKKKREAPAHCVDDLIKYL